MVAELTTTQNFLFAGAKAHSMDAKNRVVLPSDWRPLDLGRILLSPHSTRDCILGLPLNTYLLTIEKVNADETLEEDVKQAVITHFSAINEPANIDAQGRISLPDNLVKKYGMDKKVVLAGTHDRFEIYTPEAWEERKAATEAAFKAAASKLRI